MVTLEDVKVPVENLIGEENQGFMLIMTNFNHEVRWSELNPTHMISLAFCDKRWRLSASAYVL